MKLSTTIKLGIAPINWTNDDLPSLGGNIPFERCLNEMSAAGYAGTEIGTKFPKNPQILKFALEKRKLRLAGSWFSLYFSEKGRSGETVKTFIEYLEFLSTFNASYVNVCECGYSVQCSDQHVKKRNTYSDKQWQELATGLNLLGKISAEKGIKLNYHYHMGTMVQTAEETKRLLNMTDPENVFLLFDPGHTMYAGDDPVVFLKENVSRIGHVHLKDIRQTVLREANNTQMSFLDSVKAGIFTVPGDGCIDFKEIFTVLDQSGYQNAWMIVEAEQDPEKANPKEYARKARRYIKRITGL